MLPDYPKLKRDIASVLDDFVHLATAHYMGPFKSIHHLRLLEGDGHTTVWENRQEDHVPIVTHSAGVTVTHEELPTMTMGDVLAKLMEVAKQLADQQAQQIYGRLDEVTAKTGMTLNAKGQALTSDLLLSALERIH